MGLRAARSLLIVGWGIVGLFCCAWADGLDLERLETESVEQLHAILNRLEPVITAKKQNGTASLLTWEEFYQGLSGEERTFINAVRDVKAEHLGSTAHYFGPPSSPPDVVPVGRQQIVKAGSQSQLDPQHLPRNVLEAYGSMMDAMERDIGKRLLVESGYRAGAYQLYLFLFYLPKHGYSIRQTNRYVALPGYSEHGYPPRQAIDFINAEGINGEDNPEEFEALPEYRWLLTNAHRFGFYLSYPRDNPHNTAFEPWHWHYEIQ